MDEQAEDARVGGTDHATEPDAASPAHSHARRHPSTFGGAVYLVVLTATLTGVAIVTWDHWRLGVQCMAGALATAALVRLTLPRREAGMLAVRSRLLDVALLTALAAVLWFLAGSIPDQPAL